MDQPKVSCILITADRPTFINIAIENFLEQDYVNRELIIIDDGQESCHHLIPDVSNIRYFYSKALGTLGRKRNIACEKATGEIIVHMDDDDWYAPNWISRHVDTMLTTRADITGLNMVKFHSRELKISFVFERFENDNTWLCGATLAYKKKIWEKYPFANLQIGEDTDFIRNSGGRIVPFEFINGFTGGLHSGNISIKYITDIVPKFDSNYMLI